MLGDELKALMLQRWLQGTVTGMDEGFEVSLAGAPEASIPPLYLLFPGGGRGPLGYPSSYPGFETGGRGAEIGKR